MSDESKKLAQNSLDNTSDLSIPSFIVVLLLLVAIAIIGLGFTSGSIKLGTDEGRIIVLADKFWKMQPEGVVVTETVTMPELIPALEDLLPLDDGATDVPEQLNLIPVVDEELYLHESAQSYCDVGITESVEDIIEKFGSCKYYSNMELESYALIRLLML